METAIGLFNAGKYAAALARVLPQRNPEALCIAAACYNALGQADSAEESYRRVIALRPDHAFAYNNLGLLLKERNRWAEAEACYRRAIARRADYANAHNNLGLLLAEERRFTEAESCYRRAIALQPDHVFAHNNLGLLLVEERRFAEAEPCYRRAIELRPGYANAHDNLGLLLKETDRWAEAESCYRRAIGLQSDHAGAHHNLGVTLLAMRRFAEAEVCLRRALGLRPSFSADTRCELGYLLLLLGRYGEGWPLIEARFDPARRNEPVPMPGAPLPQWQGESLAGKAIVVCPEQGYGDQIQFIRYVPLLKDMGASRVTVVCRPPLAELFQTVGADCVLGGEENERVIGDHDFWISPVSLPRCCRSTLETIPATLPYLFPSESRLRHWAGRLPGGIRVGLAWRGNPEQKNDVNRSLPCLETLKPLWRAPGISFISLQKGAGAHEAANPPADQPLLDLGPAIGDFADTAAIIHQLDLVISVCTSVAHLTGALGKRCWVMLTRNADWRWLVDRPDSPWYPGVMRLFRQTTSGDWSGPVAEVADQLAMLQSGEATGPSAQSPEAASLPSSPQLG